MVTKLWLDDVRDMPDHFTHCARDAYKAIKWLKRVRFDTVSLDHDLGPDLFGRDGCGEHCGCMVALYICEAASNGTLERIPDLRCHSWNPVGRERINVILDRAKRYWDERERGSEAAPWAPPEEEE